MTVCLRSSIHYFSSHNFQGGTICCTEEALKVMGKDKEGEGGGVIIATGSVAGNHLTVLETTEDPVTLDIHLD